MAIPIAFSLNGRLEGRLSGIGWALFKNCFKYSNKSGKFIVCKVRLVRRRNYAGIDTGEQPMNMKMLGRYAMRAGAVAMCSAALCAVPMMAQGGGGGGRGMDPDAQLAQLTTVLTLSADQQAKIKPILAADAAKITALRTAQDPDMMTKVAQIRTDEHAAIKALLTADQATKYDAMPQGRGGGRRGGGGGGGAAPGGGAPPAPPQ